MSNIKRVTLHDMQPPPGKTPETTYAVDGKIETHDGREIWFPFSAEREGLTDADLERRAQAYLMQKGEEAFPYTPPAPLPEEPAEEPEA